MAWLLYFPKPRQTLSLELDICGLVEAVELLVAAAACSRADSASILIDCVTGEKRKDPREALGMRSGQCAVIVSRVLHMNKQLIV